jgi:hypothetical protein
MFWQKQAVAVCAVLEGCVRNVSSNLMTIVVLDSLTAALKALADTSTYAQHGLTQGDSREQQVALFRLLASMLKRSGDGVSDPTGNVSSVAAQVVLEMLEVASEAGAGGVDGGSVDSGCLGLLVLGRCCLQWAAALHQGVQVMQGQVAAADRSMGKVASGQAVFGSFDPL